MRDTIRFGFAYGGRLIALGAVPLVIRSPDAVPAEGVPGWDASNYSTAFDPINRRGRNPVYSPTQVVDVVGRCRRHACWRGQGRLSHPLN